MKIYQQGVAANKKGDLDEAIRCYSKAISLKPDSADLFFVRGRAYKQKDQYDMAVSDLTRAIALNPRYAEAYNHRGVPISEKGRSRRPWPISGRPANWGPGMAAPMSGNSKGQSDETGGIELTRMKWI